MKKEKGRTKNATICSHTKRSVGNIDFLVVSQVGWEDLVLKKESEE